MDVKKLKAPYEITRIDPWLEPYAGEIELRMNSFKGRRWQLVKDAKSAADFADGYLFFGIHRTRTGWVVREWLPGAEQVFLIGDFNDWDHESHPMERKDNGVWEIELEGRDALQHGQYIKLWVRRGFNAFERLPAYSTRLQMDERSHKLCTQVWDPEPFQWTDDGYRAKKAEAPLIYEAHIGMAQDREGIGTYHEFADQILPRIQRQGYNTVQLMAVQEHPYYGSFGYQVTNFFAPSSWYGEPEGLKYLINKAHALGLRVLLDVVHSHACPNVGEGLNLGDTAVQLPAGGGAPLPAEQPEILDGGIPLRRIPV